MNRKIVYKLITIFSLIIILTITTTVFSYHNTELPEISFSPIYKLFENEDKFQEQILSNVEFENLTFVKYKIERGNNFWKIARQYKVNIDTLLSANPFWESLFAKINQEIIIPSEKGTLHFINNLEEIDEIANYYNVEKQDIIVQKLPYFYAYYYKFIDNPKKVAVFVKGVKPTNKIMTEKMAKKFAVREMFRSPLGGRFSSFFGRRRHPIFKKRKFHNGLDIAARHGTAVGAACEGKVIATGWMGGYGKAVIIRHKDGYKTLYGHLSRISTRRGRTVKKGQFIGRVGSTGYSTGPHLHFTLWKNNKLINPMKILW